MNRPFAPAGATQNTAVTATSSAITLQNATYADVLRLANIGTQTIFVEVTSAASAVAATSTTSLPIPPNTVQYLTAPRSSFVSAIAGATGSTLYVTPGSYGM